jgi:hypothetical protein
MTIHHYIAATLIGIVLTFFVWALYSAHWLLGALGNIGALILMTKVGYDIHTRKNK